jgi:hypothetical protein
MFTLAFVTSLPYLMASGSSVATSNSTVMRLSLQPDTRTLSARARWVFVPKELLDFKFREPRRDRFDPQKSQSPSLHVHLPSSEDGSMARKKYLEKGVKLKLQNNQAIMKNRMT